jgi:hypothetical protein
MFWIGLVFCVIAGLCGAVDLYKSFIVNHKMTLISFSDIIGFFSASAPDSLGNMFSGSIGQAVKTFLGWGVSLTLGIPGIILLLMSFRRKEGRRDLR